MLSEAKHLQLPEEITRNETLRARSFPRVSAWLRPFCSTGFQPVRLCPEGSGFQPARFVRPDVFDREALRASRRPP
jgi:hypothetical protein